jgi:hypothetical protein
MNPSPSEETGPSAEELKDLEQAVESAEEKIEAVSSSWNVFRLGILRGLGTAVGATIIFAIFTSILAWLIGQAGVVWVEEVLQALGLERIVEE